MQLITWMVLIILDGGDKKINFNEFAKGLYNEFNEGNFKLGIKKRDDKGYII